MTIPFPLPRWFVLPVACIAFLPMYPIGVFFNLLHVYRLRQINGART